MTEETFKEISDLKDKIQDRENKYRRISSLLEHTDLVCFVSSDEATKRARGTMNVHIIDNESIAIILDRERQRVFEELSQLKNKFEKY